MFDPAKLAANNTLKDATARVVSWIKEMLPPDIRGALSARADHVMINAREVACGDPDCSPIDVVLALLFYNGRRAMTGLPMEMNRVRREDIASTLEDMHDELMACHNDTLWVPPSQLGPPPLSAAGNAALEKIAAVISEQLLPLSASDVTGVCAMAMDLLEQIEEDTNRPPPAPVRPGAGLPPRTMDPNTKILSAAQKNDVEAVSRFLDEGIPASYSNSLGQTPLHISAMWGNVEVLRVLLDRGAVVDAVNQLSNATPLHVAAASNRSVEGRLKCVAVLLNAGADPTLLDADGMAPYQMVLGQDSGPIKDLLTAAFEDKQMG